MNNNELNKFINKGFEKLELQLTNEQLVQLNKYIEFLISENKKYNLTSITDPREIVKLHFLDSAGIFLKEEINGKVIDIGTGAGFPGFVFKIINSDIDLTLLESNLKKVNFLKLLQIELNLYHNIEVIHERAEKLAHDEDYRYGYDFVTSRAVAPLNILLEYTVPFCKGKGKILLFKGPSYQKELDDSKNALDVLNVELKKIYELEIPFLEGGRFVLEFNRTDITGNKYPRKAGIPKKHPL
ncbi:MAG: 16S rRNA (guanine(527)-N(7))-methyltransferase RsmG [Halanaerobiales bacterium]